MRKWRPKCFKWLFSTFSTVVSFALRIANVRKVVRVKVNNKISYFHGILCDVMGRMDGTAKICIFICIKSWRNTPRLEWPSCYVKALLETFPFLIIFLRRKQFSGYLPRYPITPLADNKVVSTIDSLFFPVSQLTRTCIYFPTQHVQKGLKYIFEESIPIHPILSVLQSSLCILPVL